MLPAFCTSDRLAERHVYGMCLITNESHGAGTRAGLKPHGEDQPARGENVRPEICTMLPTALHAMESDFGSLKPRMGAASCTAGGPGDGLAPGVAEPPTWATEWPTARMAAPSEVIRPKWCGSYRTEVGIAGIGGSAGARAKGSPPGERAPPGDTRAIWSPREETSGHGRVGA